MDQTTKSTPAATPVQPWFYWALGAIVAVFGAVRFACLFNDLWLDEIWSLRLVQQLHSPLEILTKAWSDNNHPLNSLWLYAMNPTNADWKYRLLSWFTGTAAIALAGLIGRRLFQRLQPGEGAGRAQLAGLITAIVVGGSFFLIHYSSEARGYAPAVGFGFLAIYALTHASGRPGSRWAWVYGVACVLGLLSHLVAFQVMLAGLAWSGAVMFRRWKGWRDRLMHLFCWHLAPWLFLAFYYLGFVRRVEIGGGPVLALSNVLGTLAAFSLGLPSSVWFVALLPFLSIIVYALALLWRWDRALWGFFVTGIFVAPAIGLCSSRFVLLYPRYFIVSAALGLLLVGYVLAQLWSTGRWSRVVVALLLGVFLWGNGVHAQRLLHDGRGQYQAALQYIAERTPAGAITVSSDADFRNFTVMDYYTKTVGPGRTLRYYPANQLPPDGPQWIFLHRLDDSVPPPPAYVHDAEGRNYQLDRVFPHAPLSGWEWYVYRTLDPAVLPPAPR